MFRPSSALPKVFCMLLFILDGYVSMTVFTLAMLLLVERITVQQVSLVFCFGCAVTKSFAVL